MTTSPKMSAMIVFLVTAFAGGTAMVETGGGIGYFLDDGDLILGGFFSAKRVDFK